MLTKVYLKMFEYFETNRIVISNKQQSIYIVNINLYMSSCQFGTVDSQSKALHG